MSNSDRERAARIAQLARSARSSSPIELRNAAEELGAISRDMERRAETIQEEDNRDKCGRCGWWYYVGTVVTGKGDSARSGFCMNAASKFAELQKYDFSSCHAFKAGAHGELCGVNFVGGFKPSPA